MTVNETNLAKLKAKYGNFQIINKNEILLESGEKVFTNTAGEQSGRLLSYKIDAVFRNGKFIHSNSGNNCFLNLNRFTFERSGQIVSNTEFVLSLHDVDKHYYIKLPIGKVMIMLKCRELVPDTMSLSDMYRNALNSDLEGLLITAYFKSLIDGDNIVELLVKKRKRFKRAVIEPKIRM